MSSRNELTRQTKQNIVDAFWSLYCEKRIEKITVKDITQKAGYNRSTFYEYFKDPLDVLEYLELSLIPNIETIPPIQTDHFVWGAPLDSFMDLYEHHAGYYSVLLGENGDPAFANKLKKAVKPLLKTELKSVVQVDEIKLDYILEYVLTATIGIMSYWFNQENPIAKTELYDLMHALMTEGIVKQLN